MLPNWMDKNETKKKANKNEKRFVQTLNSGSLPFDKGDIKSEDTIIEYKHTSKKSYSLKLEDLIKCKKQAQQMGKIPIFIVNFDDKFIIEIREVFDVKRYKK